MHLKFRSDKSCKSIPWKSYEEGNSRKGNNYFLSSLSKFKQLYIQLKTLFTNQSLCNGNCLCIILCKYIHGPFWAKIHTLIVGKSLTYFRYINDIFLIWTGTKNELDQFFKNLNKKDPSTKFYNKASKNRIVFLDSEIYLHNGKLYTKIYRKETDRHHYLHIKSEHP